MTNGLTALPGGFLFGVLWRNPGTAVAFVVAAVIATLWTIVLLRSTRSR